MNDYVYVVISIGGTRRSHELHTIDEAIAYLSGAKTQGRKNADADIEDALKNFPSEGDGY
jgi:hypothetical protein